MTVKILGARKAGTVGDDAIGMLSDDAFDDVSEELDELELLEFLAADLDPVPADPVFRQALGERLWEMVQKGLPRPRSH